MCWGERGINSGRQSGIRAKSYVSEAIIEVITGEIRKEPYWTMTFANEMFLSRMRSER